MIEVWAKPLPEGCKLQIGEATFAGDPKAVALAGSDWSIRVSYPRSDGRHRRSSPETSLYHLVEEVKFAAEAGALTKTQREEILAAVGGKKEASG